MEPWVGNTRTENATRTPPFPCNTSTLLERPDLLVPKQQEQQHSHYQELIPEWYLGCLAHCSDSEATTYHSNAQFSKEQFWVSFSMPCVKLLHGTLGRKHKNRECHQNATIPMQHIDTVRAPRPGLHNACCWLLSTSLATSPAAASSKNSNTATTRN